jgi:hypothetical protein
MNQRHHIDPVSRRDFLLAAATASLGLWAYREPDRDLPSPVTGPPHAAGAARRIGIIGLDSSHCVEFTRLLNASGQGLGGYTVTTAYPYGSRTLPGAAVKIAANIPAMRSMGVQIAGSAEELIASADAVMLLTNDGRLHRAGALEVFKAQKPLFIDKPLAASLDDVVAIYTAAMEQNVPVFSASSLRYMDNLDAICAGNYGAVLGADIYGPAPIEPAHPDLFWYGIHGMEVLCRVMGTGCRSVTRVHTATTDIVTGIWPGDRVGVFRGTRSGPFEYGGTVFCEKTDTTPGAYHGYQPLLEAITAFFTTGVSPVAPAATLELYAIMAAADDSKRQNGNAVQPVKLKIPGNDHEETTR